MAYVYIYYDPRKEPIEPIYVGKGNDNRITEHLYKSSNNILNAKIKKIKDAGLEPIYKKYIDNISDEDAYLIEIKLIEKFGKIYNKTGTLCNYIDGGKGGRLGFEHSEETKKLFSKQRKGKKQTDKQYLANCNRTCSEETKNKISIKLKGIKRSTESIEKTRQWHLGSKRSEETKKLFSEQRKGKKQSDEHIFNAKISRKLKYKRKKVKCLNNDKIYDNVYEASLDLNLKETAINAVANGTRKHHKNYNFIYINDEKNEMMKIIMTKEEFKELLINVAKNDNLETGQQETLPNINFTEELQKKIEDIVKINKFNESDIDFLLDEKYYDPNNDFIIRNILEKIKNVDLFL